MSCDITGGPSHDMLLMYAMFVIVVALERLTNMLSVKAMLSGNIKLTKPLEPMPLRGLMYCR